MKTKNQNFPKFENAFAECEVTDWWGDFTGIVARLVARQSLNGGLCFEWISSAHGARKMRCSFDSAAEAVGHAKSIAHFRHVRELGSRQ
ncbi:MAG: hypothetical protein IKE66_01155 [Hyphomicrobium sp.]|nr:hypothetical protein [Hyphomicrobium sp.]